MTLLSQADAIAQREADSSDPFRQRFHITPPSGLLNDPNGFIHHKGIYHLFYQWNPFECTHGNKFWAHCTSKDLIHWTRQATALAPDQDYDKNGCYSGSAFVKDDELMLFYTGNLKPSDGNRVSTQCLVKATEDALSFKKIGPVIHRQPEGYTAHFRDPKIWQHEGSWYTVLGAQTTDLKGQVLLYRSDNATNWQFIGPLAGNGLNGLKDFGYMWECPDFFELNGQDLLICSPQGLAAEGNKYQNAHQSGYFTGQYDWSTHQFTHGGFTELDRGFEFYAPQTTIDAKGRRLMSAWMGIPDEDDQPTLNDNWLHSLTLMRELKYHDGRLYQTPIEELEQLRKNATHFESMQINAQQSFSALEGDCCEIKLKLSQMSGRCGIRLREYDGHYVDLSFDPSTCVLSLDRNATENQSGVRRCQLDNNELLTLQIYLDKSSIEVFVNGGEEVFTSRVFPLKEAKGISIYSQGTCMVQHLSKYDLS